MDIRSRKSVNKMRDDFHIAGNSEADKRQHKTCQHKARWILVKTHLFKTWYTKELCVWNCLYFFKFAFNCFFFPKLRNFGDNKEISQSSGALLGRGCFVSIVKVLKFGGRSNAGLRRLSLAKTHSKNSSPFLLKSKKEKYDPPEHFTKRDTDHDRQHHFSKFWISYHLLISLPQHPRMWYV